MAAAVAWHAAVLPGDPKRVSLVGYGDVDNTMLEVLRHGERMVTLDLSPQFQNTVDEIDASFTGGDPFLFYHHQSASEKFSNRPWAVVDVRYCGALVYWNWLMDNADGGAKRRVEPLRGMVAIANDRDLWINENPDGRLWQAMVTICGEWGALARLLTNPDPALTWAEREMTARFVESQEERFNRARERITLVRIGNGAGMPREMAFLGDGCLEFGDTSDFCGSILDRPEPGACAPAVVALAYRKPSGGWAVSLRSREGLAGRAVSLLRDGRKIRGGGHGDAAALYLPAAYTEESIRESVRAALAANNESSSGMGVTLGDLLGGAR